MGKLFSYEWKRYRIFFIVMLSAAAGLGLLLMAYTGMYPALDESEKSVDFVNEANLYILCLLLVVVPYLSVIYLILSYIADIGRKGMIFLTPVSTWKIITSKLIVMSVLYILIYFISTGGILLSGIIAQGNGDFDISDTMKEMVSYRFSITGDDIGMTAAYFLSLLKGFTSVLHMSLLFMAAVSLARFAVNSVGVQVLLSIVFYMLVSLTERLIETAVSMLFFKDDESMLKIFIEPLTYSGWIVVSSIVYSAVLYIITVCLTDKKVNLVS